MQKWPSYWPPIQVESMKNHCSQCLHAFRWEMAEFVGVSGWKFEHSASCLHGVHSTTSHGWTKTEPTEYLHRPLATSWSEDKLHESTVIIIGGAACIYAYNVKIKQSPLQCKSESYPKTNKDGPHIYKCNIKACLCNRYCRGKAISITYSECVSLASIIQHARHMHSIKLSSAASLAVPYFFTYLINSIIFLKHLSFYEELSKILSYMYIILHVMYPLFLSNFN